MLVSTLLPAAAAVKLPAKFASANTRCAATRARAISTYMPSLHGRCIPSGIGAHEPKKVAGAIVSAAALVVAALVANDAVVDV